MRGVGNFSDCLVDGDSESLERAHRMRQEALAVSICIEFGLLAIMLLWPLITPGVLPDNLT